MSGNPTPEYLHSLLAELCKLPEETSWVEFKENNAKPQDIGEYLSLRVPKDSRGRSFLRTDRCARWIVPIAPVHATSTLACVMWDVTR